MTVSEHRERLAWRPALPRRHSLPWVVRYQGRMVAADASCGMLAAAIALPGRFAGQPVPFLYLATTAGLPLAWIGWLALAGGYDPRFIKGIFDRLTATAALCLLAPVLAVIAIAIVVRDGGPVLCSQTRIGQDGRPFEVLKFRTMVTVTGKWLRRWSLDGLPQLFNVVRGQMSLVGPRPPLPSEVTGYGHDVRLRLLVKPGLTGLWQVSGRSELSREEAARLDRRYVENWSLALDLQILWKTGAAVAKGRGAS